MAESSPLPPYSGSSTKCVKCCSHHASTTFLASGRCDHASSHTIASWQDTDSNPRLHRTCDTCGYSWDEATMDAAGPATVTVKREVLDAELESLWHDLYEAKRAALNGQWSIGCDNKAHRIREFSKVIGALPWEKVQIDLLLDGTYESLHAEWGIKHEPVDHGCVQAMKDRRDRETQAHRGR